MKRGKQTCKILKEIRKQIAEANDIDFITSECQYQGDCLGTCPKCEAEVHYLEQQLEYKRMKGKTITILGISAGLMAMAPLASCTSPTNKTNQATTQEVVNDTIVAFTSPLLLPAESIMAGDVKETKNTTAKESKSLVSEPDSLSSKEEYSRNDTLDMVEQMPAYPGGHEAMLKFIAKEICDPSIQGNVTQGRVVVKFVVDKEGNVVNPQVIRGVDPFLDKEALRVVSKMPKWEPGTQNGKKVAVWYTIPVYFKLQ